MKLKKKKVSAYYTLTCEDMKHATGLTNATSISSVVGLQWCKVFLLSFACYDSMKQFQTVNI